MSRLHALNQFISEGEVGSRTTTGEVKFYIFDMGSELYVDIYRKNRTHQWRNYKTFVTLLEQICRD